MKYYKKRKASKTRTYKKRPIRAKKKKTTLRTLVRREIHRLAENKINTYESVAYYVQQPIVEARTYSIIPFINQGTGVSNRVGNRIRVISFKMKMICNVFNGVTNQLPSFFDVYIFKYKNWSQQNGTTLPAGAMNEFLQVNNSSQGYTGVSTDYMRSVNDDQFRLLHKRRVYLFNPINTASYYGGTAQIQPMRMLYFDLIKDIKKTLEYDDASNTITNDNLWIGVGSTQQDGSVLIGNIGTYQFMTELKYEDM